MALIVGVHGIAQELKGENTLHQEWFPPLQDGLLRAGGIKLSEEDLFCAFYGNLFRKQGMKAVGAPPYDARDVTAEDAEVLEAWWQEAARVDPHVAAPGEVTKGVPQGIQRGLNALSRSRFFAGMAERALIGALKQVQAYFRDPAVRQAICGRVEAAVTPETQVMLAHSLGTVVAYECLCAHPEWNITTLVTLGSPLGIHNLIFDRLLPSPQNGIGVWPGSVQRWTNIADNGDVVALVKALSPEFGGKVEDHLVDNENINHSIMAYLTAEETGRAIAAGLKS